MSSILALLLLLAAYFLPGIIALARSHRNAAPILLVTFFFGWTGFGWLIALIWSFTDHTRS